MDISELLYVRHILDLAATGEQSVFDVNTFFIELGISKKDGADAHNAEYAKEMLDKYKSAIKIVDKWIDELNRF